MEMLCYLIRGNTGNKVLQLLEGLWMASWGVPFYEKANAIDETLEAIFTTIAFPTI